MAGSSFAVGVGFVSRWTPPAQQGGALGIYGLGNIGQSAAVFWRSFACGAASGGRTSSTARGAAGRSGRVAFSLLARNAPATVRPAARRHGARAGLERVPALLSLFYFLTFGGFVAFSIYLPTLLRDQFSPHGCRRRFRTAGFVVLATLLRPVGGWLSDRIGGARVLAVVFLGVVPFALLLGWNAMVPFTVGALGCAALMGLGNGAVFKLVPQYLPRGDRDGDRARRRDGRARRVLPPLLLGVFRDRLGVVWPGFVLLAAMALVLWEVNRRVFLPSERDAASRSAPRLRRTADRLRAGAWATLCERPARRSDRRWLAQPAELRPGAGDLHLRGDLCDVGDRVSLRGLDPEATDAALLPARVRTAATRRDVREHRVSSPPPSSHTSSRSGSSASARALRWWMHQFLFWGCLSAVAITFPLVFGWIHFRSAPGDQMTYVTYLFGFPTGSFRMRTALSWVLFHGLDFSAALVLAGIASRCGGACAIEVRSRCRISPWTSCRWSCSSRFR